MKCEVLFDPAVGFDVGSVNVYHGENLISQGEIVDAEIVKDLHNLLHVKSGPLPMPSEHKFGDKVRIIILPNE